MKRAIEGLRLWLPGAGNWPRTPCVRFTIDTNTRPPIVYPNLFSNAQEKQAIEDQLNILDICSTIEQLNKQSATGDLVAMRVAGLVRNAFQFNRLAYDEAHAINIVGWGNSGINAAVAAEVISLPKAMELVAKEARLVSSIKETFPGGMFRVGTTEFIEKTTKAPLQPVEEGIIGGRRCCISRLVDRGRGEREACIGIYEKVDKLSSIISLRIAYEDREFSELNQPEDPLHTLLMESFRGQLTEFIDQLPMKPPRLIIVGEQPIKTVEEIKDKIKRELVESIHEEAVKRALRKMHAHIYDIGVEPKKGDNRSYWPIFVLGGIGVVGAALVAKQLIERRSK